MLIIAKFQDKEMIYLNFGLLNVSTGLSEEDIVHDLFYKSGASSRKFIVIPRSTLQMAWV